MKTIFLLAAAAATLAACAGHSHLVGTDPWLLSRKSSDCAQPACLFAIVEDSAGRPLSGATVEITGTDAHVLTDPRGRIALQGINEGSRRIRLTYGGQALETGEVTFGYPLQALTIQLYTDHAQVIR